MKFPYYKQKTDYTCGPACLKMILKSFGIKKSEKELVKLLKTNDRRGTLHRNMIKGIEKFKLHYVTKTNGKIEYLKKLHREGYKIIVCFYYNSNSKKCYHYSIVGKIGPRRIYFHDPWFGQNHSYNIQHFKKLWISNPKYEHVRGWFVAVKT